jgi:hypothetical protein
VHIILISVFSRQAGGSEARMSRGEALSPLRNGSDSYGEQSGGTGMRVLAAGATGVADRSACGTGRQ